MEEGVDCLGHMMKALALEALLVFICCQAENACLISGASVSKSPLSIY